MSDDDTEAWERWWDARLNSPVSNILADFGPTPPYFFVPEDGWNHNRLAATPSDEMEAAHRHRYGLDMRLFVPWAEAGDPRFYICVIEGGFWVGPRNVMLDVWRPWDDVQLRDAFPPIPTEEFRRMLSLPTPPTIRDVYLDMAPSNLPERDWQRLNDLLLELYPDPAVGPGLGRFGAENTPF